MAWHTAKSLAKPLHGIVASVSILFFQASCIGLTMTVAPSFKCMYLYMISPTTFAINSFPSLSEPSPSVPLQNPAFWGSNWPIWSYPRNPKAFHPWTLIKACAPGPALSLYLHPALTSSCYCLRYVIYILQDLWLINYCISISTVAFGEMWLTIWHCVLHLANVNLIKS